MATTDFGALDVARVRFWAAKALVGGRDASFYRSNGFVGENSQDQTKPIQRITELTKTSKGTKVFALAGKIRRGGLIEVPMGTTIREIVEDIGGGVAPGRKFKAVQIGGPSGG